MTNPVDFEPPVLPDPNVNRTLIQQAIAFEVRGRVSAVAGESVEIEGMTAAIGSICELKSQDGAISRARVIGFRGVRPILAPLERLNALAAGDSVRLVDTTLKLRVGPSLCGRVIDAFGKPVDGKPLPKDLMRVDAEQEPPESLKRPAIDQPLQTGIRAIDTMLTCGRGQRLGIFAGSGVGKSTLLGMLARGSNADRIVIGMVGERGREVQEFLNRALGDAGFARSVVVVATSDRPAAQRVSAAWTATAIAEAFRDQGENVLLLLDSVTRFAMAQRELGLAAGEPPTTRGYPPSVFNVLPRLVERAGRTEQGSITAFYTVLVEGDDHNEPIADALRGLLDGHFVLSRDLAAKAHWPPIDILHSLSRLQPHLVSREALQSAAIARQHLSEYQRHADLISIGAYRQGSDPRVDAAIAMREPLNLFLRQEATQITKLEDSNRMLSQLVGAQTAPNPANVNVATQPPASVSAVGESPGISTS
ncbi:MAG: FliI/YscN family ATPase [Rubripirellula sp.]|nr:flagellum-specific ATP synthase FliI [Rhodopirellula sp.]MCH1439981.1 FliI/YscN family ATPase [Rubripirellula sp.]OUX07361.1 MAG: flagellum-specific ATP synthase FliI [Planctomycetaceae bacterium TMED240]